MLELVFMKLVKRMGSFLRKSDLIYLLTILLIAISSTFVNTIRQKRSLAFTRGSSFGYLAAVAIPVDLPKTNLYVAFNLETNYGLPPNDTHYALIDKWNLSGMFSDINNDVTHIDGRRKQRSLYTRTHFYRCLINYFEHFGLNGTGCLLRSICEVADSNIYASNGVLGSIFHILFLPSYSKEEHLKPPIYEAEKRGYINECATYEDVCPEGFLNKISIVF